jgi:hypothetical protein
VVSRGSNSGATVDILLDIAAPVGGWLRRIAEHHESRIMFSYHHVDEQQRDSHARRRRHRR